MSLYDGVKTRVRVDYELSEELEAKVGMYQGSVLSLFLLSVVEDVAELLQSPKDDLTRKLIACWEMPEHYLSAR